MQIRASPRIEAVVTAEPMAEHSAEERANRAEGAAESHAVISSSCRSFFNSGNGGMRLHLVISA